MSTIITPFQGTDSFSTATFNNRISQINTGFSYISNPNLLDNWYFGNPVDQRQGRVVVPNTTYYSDNTLTTSAGTTSAYVTAYRYATGTASGVNYASFKLEDSDTAPTYYAAPGNVVRGYTGAGYGIDRWKLLTSQCTVTIDNDGITLHRNGGDQWIYAQPLEPELVTALTGKSVVISTLTDAGLVEFPVSSAFTAEQSVVSTSGTCIWLSTSGHLFLGTTADSVKLKAAKLELGSTQTLAHQDDNGNWVLNEIPDYGEQLARCQRYYEKFIFAGTTGASPVGMRFQNYLGNDADLVTIGAYIYFATQKRTVPVVRIEYDIADGPTQTATVNWVDERCFSSTNIIAPAGQFIDIHWYEAIADL